MNNSCMEESVMFIFPFGIQVFDFGLAQIVKFKCKHFFFYMKKAALPCSTKKWKKGIFIIHDGLCHSEKRIDIFRELTKGW